MPAEIFHLNFFLFLFFHFICSGIYSGSITSVSILCVREHPAYMFVSFTTRNNGVQKHSFFFLLLLPSFCFYCFSLFVSPLHPSLWMIRCNNWCANRTPLNRLAMAHMCVYECLCVFLFTAPEQKCAIYFFSRWYNNLRYHSKSVFLGFRFRFSLGFAVS